VRIRLLSAFVAIVLSTGCSSSTQHAQTPASASDAPRSGSIFLWHASKKGKPGSVYLLGSVHLRREKSSLDRAITDVATECERGAFEVDLDAVDPNETSQFVREKGVLEGKTLKDVVAPETFAAWSKAADANHLPRATLEKLKPWMAALATQVAVLEKRGIGGDQGIDRMLYSFEKQEPTKARKVIGLETVREQLELLSSGSPKLQDLMLRSTATEIESDQIGKMLALYESGNEAGMTQLLDKSQTNDPEMKQFSEAIFDRRNVTMTDKVVPMFDAPGCTVVTVGVGHTLGESGIVRRLRNKGFDVERVSSKGPADSAKLAFTVDQPKEFVSQEDGFSVRALSKPAIQEVPVPGIPVKARSYVFSDGTTMAAGITVLRLPDAAAASKLSGALEPLSKEGLAREGVKVTGTESTTVDGKKAVRVRGENAQGEVRAAQVVGWVHNQRFYSITVKLVGDGDPKKVEETMNQFVQSFRHTP
jgi:uncharacterized protein YbaP (TraB family)